MGAMGLSARTLATSIFVLAILAVSAAAATAAPLEDQSPVTGSRAGDPAAAHPGSRSWRRDASVHRRLPIAVAVPTGSARPPLERGRPAPRPTLRSEPEQLGPRERRGEPLPEPGGPARPARERSRHGPPSEQPGGPPAPDSAPSSDQPDQGVGVTPGDGGEPGRSDDRVVVALPPPPQTHERDTDPVAGAPLPSNAGEQGPVTIVDRGAVPTLDGFDLGQGSTHPRERTRDSLGRAVSDLATNVPPVARVFRVPLVLLLLLVAYLLLQSRLDHGTLPSAAGVPPPGGDDDDVEYRL